MLLFELFQQPREWTNPSKGKYRFTVGDIQYSVGFYEDPDDSGAPIYEVSFRVEGANEEDPDYFTKTSGISGTGNAAVVLSTVVDIIQHFISIMPKPLNIMFSAVEPSRNKLYTAMGNRLAKKYGYKFEFSNYYDGYIVSVPAK